MAANLAAALRALEQGLAISHAEALERLRSSAARPGEPAAITAKRILEAEGKAVPRELAGPQRKRV